MTGVQTCALPIYTDILPSSGTLEIDGVKTTESIFDFDSHAKKVLYIKQDFFCDGIKAIDNLALNYEKEMEYDERLKDVVDTFDESFSISNNYETLSSGQKILLLLFLAKKKKVELILLDEPTANLGDEEVDRAEEYLLNLAKHCQVIIATNDDKLSLAGAKTFYIRDEEVYDYEI